MSGFRVRCLRARIRRVSILRVCIHHDHSLHILVPRALVHPVLVLVLRVLAPRFRSLARSMFSCSSRLRSLRRRSLLSRSSRLCLQAFVLRVLVPLFSAPSFSAPALRFPIILLCRHPHVPLSRPPPLTHTLPAHRPPHRRARARQLPRHRPVLVPRAAAPPPRARHEPYRAAPQGARARRRGACSFSCVSLARA